MTPVVGGGGQNSNDIRGEKNFFRVTQICCKFKENLMILKGSF